VGVFCLVLEEGLGVCDMVKCEVLLLFINRFWDV